MTLKIAGATPSLDEQYITFRDQTEPVFALYPEIQPLRFELFKEQLVGRKVDGWKEYAKRWIRPCLRRTHTRCPPHPSDVLIWFEGHRPAFLGTLLPVYQELQSRGVSVQLVSRRGKGTLPGSTLCFQYPASALSPKWTGDAWEGLCDIVEEFRSRAFHRTFYHHCAMMQAQIDEMERLLESIRPKVVVHGTSIQTGGGTLSVVARRHGIPSLQLQHGMTQAFYTPVIDDFMLTWGDISSERLIRTGQSCERLVALGSPRHDTMGVSSNSRARAALHEALSLPNRPTLGFFSSDKDPRNGTAPFESAQWLEAVAARHSQSMNFVVRLHPSEDGSLYQGARHLRITKGIPDMGTTLEGCELLGAICSTAMDEALLYGKSVLQFYADGWPELADNWKMGMARRVSSQEELEQIVTDLSTRSGCDRLPMSEAPLERVFKNHGCATHVVADFIEEQLSNSAERADGIPNLHAKWVQTQ